MNQSTRTEVLKRTLYTGLALICFMVFTVYVRSCHTDVTCPDGKGKISVAWYDEAPTQNDISALCYPPR